LLIAGAEMKIAVFAPEGHESWIGGFQPVTFRCVDAIAATPGPAIRGRMTTASCI
jgi:hypothetical protein